MRPYTLAATLALFVLPLAAQADAPAPPAPESAPSPGLGASDPRVTRLLGAKDTLRWNYSPAGRNARYGHAEALVAAPADKVFKVAQDYSHYRELHRKFATARVVAKEGENTDIYMRYPVKIGPVVFEFHEVMRFGSPRMNGPVRMLEANGIKGDMRQGHAVIAVEPVDATHSLLVVDILLVPNVPAPQFLIDEELRDGAGDFVNGLKDRSQGFVGPVTAL
ncbi:MAG: hypothetical protein U0235_34125 [Polyangiaceae bacterium]